MLAKLYILWPAAVVPTNALPFLSLCKREQGLPLHESTAARSPALKHVLHSLPGTPTARQAPLESCVALLLAPCLVTCMTLFRCYRPSHRGARAPLLDQGLIKQGAHEREANTQVVHPARARALAKHVTRCYTLHSRRCGRCLCAVWEAGAASAAHALPFGAAGCVCLIAAGRTLLPPRALVMPSRGVMQFLLPSTPQEHKRGRAGGALAHGVSLGITDDSRRRAAAHRRACASPSLHKSLQRI